PCAPPWNATQVYTGSLQASVNGINYQANFWTQGDNPTTHNGPGGSGQPWTSLGACGDGGGGGGTCTVVPGSPAGLTSPSQTSDSVSLSWTAASAGPGCSISYRVLQNGTQVTTTSATSATVSGLGADTAFSFSVVASDEAGNSPASTPLSVRTRPGGPNTCTA